MSLSSALSFLRKPSSSSSSNVTTANASSSTNMNTSQPPLHIAIEGCAHGELDKIYDECAKHEQEEGKKIDFLICCGDFQSIRSGDDLQREDLESIHIPKKYLSTGDFPKYFSSEKKAPILTLVIGGNHEASNFLFEQYYGGFLCENIYYLGHSGVINVGGITIAGLSGIFKIHDFQRLYPVPPYHGDEGQIRGAYHVRRFEIEKLKMLVVNDNNNNQSDDNNHHNNKTGSINNNENSGKKNIDIFISHDWPVGVTDFGDVDDLLRKKPYFKEDIEKKELGNPHTMELLSLLQPRYSFAAHLHVRFKALIHHAQGHTEFLALDKCVRHTKEFLQFMNILPQVQLGHEQQQPLRDPFTNQLIIYHDPDWIEIVRKTHVNVPLSLANNSNQPTNVEWVVKSYLPLRNRLVMDPVSMRERRERQEQGEGKRNVVVEFGARPRDAVQATTTMDLLQRLGLCESNVAATRVNVLIDEKKNDEPQVNGGTAEQKLGDDNLLSWGEDV